MSSIRRIPLTLAVLAAVAAGAGAAAAQEATTIGALVAGARVRLEWAAGGSGPRTGSVGKAGPDSAGFPFRPGRGERARRVEFASLSSLEVLTDRKSHTGEGMLIGLLAGFAAAYVFTPDEGRDLDPRPFVALPAGLVGVVIGGAIGSARSSGTWAPVPLR